MAIGNIKLAGVAVGAGAALLGNVIIPTLGGAFKSLTKTLIKSSLLTYQGSRRLVDQTTKAIEHIAAEAKAEVKKDAGQKPTAKTTQKRKKPQAQAAS